MKNLDMFDIVTNYVSSEFLIGDKFDEVHETWDREFKTGSLKGNLFISWKSLRKWRKVFYF